MAQHTIYFAHAGAQREQAPPLELLLVSITEDKPAVIEEAGHTYGKWLLRNASGTWVKGLRRALEEFTTTSEPGAPLPYEHKGDDD